MAWSEGLLAARAKRDARNQEVPWRSSLLIVGRRSRRTEGKTSEPQPEEALERASLKALSTSREAAREHFGGLGLRSESRETLKSPNQ